MININTKLDAVTYAAVVNELAANYFDSNGQYAPHIGFMNAMCTFYNVCVVDGDLTEKISTDMDILDAVNILATNDEFMKDFNEATWPASRCLDFANAYSDAMKIVDTKKSSLHYVVDLLTNALDGIVDKISPALTKENLEMTSKIAESMSKNQNLSKSLVEEYMKSDRFKEVVNPTATPDLTVVK